MSVPAKTNTFELKTWAHSMVKEQVVQLLPKGDKDWPGFEVALRSSILQNPKLREAIANAPDAALLSVVKCARLGLSLDPAMEHFALIPYKNVVQGQVMVRGWIHLIHQSNRTDFIDGDVIYQEEYDPTCPLKNPTNGRIIHVPRLLERDQWSDDEIIGAYAQAKLTGQDRYVSVVLGRKRIDALRAMGFGDTPAWKDHLPRMCVVKAVKTLARSGFINLMPIVQQELKLEEEAEAAAVAAVPPDAMPALAPVRPRVKTDTTALPDHWDEGKKEEFKQLEAEPLPSEDDAEMQAQAALQALMTELQTTPRELGLVTLHLFKTVIDLPYLTKVQATKVAAYLRKETPK